MKIKTYGDFGNPKLLLFHPLFTDDQVFDKIVSKLIDDFYIVVPIFSGHYPNSTYTGIDKEELELSIYLKSHNINKIDILLGISFGGNIAYDFFYKNTDLIDKVIIDSSPLYKLPNIIRKIVYFKYRQLIIKVLKNRDETSTYLTKINKFLSPYQKDVITLINEKSLKNIINTCLDTTYYNLSDKNQKKITFIYGTKDKNRNSLRRFKKYKYSRFIKVNNADNTEYIIKKPTSYIKKIIKVNNYDKIESGDNNGKQRS